MILRWLERGYILENTALYMLCPQSAGSVFSSGRGTVG